MNVVFWALVSSLVLVGGFGIGAWITARSDLRRHQAAARRDLRMAQEAHQAELERELEQEQQRSYARGHGIGYTAGFAEAKRTIMAKTVVGQFVQYNVDFPPDYLAVPDPEHRARYVERYAIPDARRSLQEAGWWPIAPPELSWSTLPAHEPYGGVQRCTLLFLCMPTQPFPAPEHRHRPVLFEKVADPFDRFGL